MLDGCPAPPRDTFDLAFHGRGYATETVCAVVEQGSRSMGAERIFAPILVGNLTSHVVRGPREQLATGSGVGIDRGLVLEEAWQAIAANTRHGTLSIHGCTT